jgi:hypothetical protein
MEKDVVGLTEIVKIHGGKKIIEVSAICDTGASTTSIDMGIASEIELGPIVGQTNIKNPSFDKFVKRPVVNCNVEVCEKVFNIKANLQDRSHMTHKVIIGRDILHNNFVVDVSVSHSGYSVKTIKDEETKMLLNKYRFVDVDENEDEDFE